MTKNILFSRITKLSFAYTANIYICKLMMSSNKLYFTIFVCLCAIGHQIYHTNALLSPEKMNEITQICNATYKISRGVYTKN